MDCIKGAIKELEKSTMVNDLEYDNVLGNGALNIKQSFEVGYFPLIFLILYVKNVGALWSYTIFWQLEYGSKESAMFYFVNNIHILSK